MRNVSREVAFIGEPSQSAAVVGRETSAQSKYVSREIKYADRQDKRIVTIRLDDTPLPRDLQMLLEQYQIMSAAKLKLSDLSRALGPPHG
jgi:hypothetical protein